ncbi:hypothetical protein E2C01_090385 [Portunus trituberculatus]|uniref:Uncharacterized protein n=1 Tax=Portunus trituberculatus TaxID=210409 RepID=A0A5B7JPY9_PORTR|nr:hypothetical protein [Portunus trituberculatus]
MHYLLLGRFHMSPPPRLTNARTSQFNGSTTPQHHSTTPPHCTITLLSRLHCTATVSSPLSRSANKIRFSGRDTPTTTTTKLLPSRDDCDSAGSSKLRGSWSERAKRLRIQAFLATRYSQPDGGAAQATQHPPLAKTCLTAGQHTAGRAPPPATSTALRSTYHHHHQHHHHKNNFTATTVHQQHQP